MSTERSYILRVTLSAWHHLRSALNASTASSATEALQRAANIIHRGIQRLQRRQKLQNVASEVLRELHRTGRFNNRLISVFGGLACWNHNLHWRTTNEIDLVVEDHGDADLINNLTNAMLARPDSPFVAYQGDLFHQTPSGVKTRVVFYSSTILPFMPSASIAIGNYNGTVTYCSERDMLILKMDACAWRAADQERRKDAFDARHLLLSIWSSSSYGVNLDMSDRNLVQPGIVEAARLTGTDPTWWEAHI